MTRRPLEKPASRESRLPIVFCSPMRYVQGPGITRSLAAEMQAVGLAGPALVVAGNTATTRLAPLWAASLAEAGWDHRVLAFGGESCRGEIDAIAAEAAAFGAGVIVGVGGGKTLDAARAAAAVRRIPFVSCPTVCSTDAPTSALSVIYSDSGPNRGAVDAYEIHRRSPDLVLVDTQVIAESPPRLLAAGIGDALSTFYEARAAVAAEKPNMRGGRCTLAALALARLCRDVIFDHGVSALEACRRREVDDDLEKTVEAATLLSGLGFESAGLAAAHAIHNGLTAVAATHGMLHGEKVAFGTLVQLALEVRAADADAGRRDEMNHVAAFCARVGLPVTLRQLGIAGGGAVHDAVLAIARRATIPGETIHNMPFPIDAAMAAAAIAAADAVGEAAVAARYTASETVTEPGPPRSPGNA
jgi:glycerol dehydrogenase